MKKQILKRLSACLPMGMAFIVTTMLFSASANAQIVYTDINPDSTNTCSGSSCSKTYNLDLNNDGISDYSITSVRTGNICQHGGLVYRSYVLVSALDSNAVVAVTSTTYPRAMNFNDKIFSGFSLSTSGYVWNRYWGNCGSGALNLWPNSVDRYLGLKLIVGANTYYGWARMQVVFGTQPTFTIKDYAYNTIPNQPILAGETSCTIPTVGLTQSGSLSFCAGDSVTLTANGTGYLYQWKRNNVDIAGATAKTYTAKTAGIYRCKVTNSCGSKGSGTRTVTVPCRLTNEAYAEQLESSFEIEITPNPVSSSTTISFSLNQSENVSLKIFDLNGRLIETLASTVLEEGEHLIEWNAENVNAGVYFLQVQTAAYSKTTKLVVTK